MSTTMYEQRVISTTAIGVQAVEHHRKMVRFFSTVELINALEQEKVPGKVGQLSDRPVRLDLERGIVFSLRRCGTRMRTSRPS